jgi:hypothetical protein
MNNANHRPAPDRLSELRKLIARLCEDELDADEVARLEEILCADEACCEYYITAMQITAALPRYANKDGSGVDSSRSGQASFGATPPWVPKLPDLDSWIEPGAPTDLLATEFRSSIFAWPVRGWFAMSVVMAIGISLSVLGGWWWGVASRPVSERVVKSLGVDAIRLESGSAELALPGVGYVLVDGPAELVLLDSMRARLTKGTVRVHVTEKSGHGFTVETPYGDVVDLGTEFGLNVPENGSAGLVVFDGAVDLLVKSPVQAENPIPVQRLVRGEAVTFDRSGQLGRIDSIVTGTVATFLQTEQASVGSEPPLIVSVSDNDRQSGTGKFYEIVPGGLREDVLAFVDRPAHEWNGFTQKGLPPYLIGADYIKTFSNDKNRHDFELYVAFSRPARMFIFFDDRVPTPTWLTENFRNTGDCVGLDSGTFHRGDKTIRFRRGVGPGQSIDARLTVWERIVSKPGIVTLHANGSQSDLSTMFGIAAVPLEAETR